MRLWEVDAKLALDLERPSLLSLVPFMKHSWAQLVEALRRIRSAAKDALELFWHALLLRYSRDEAEKLRLEVGMNSAIMEKIWKELLPDSPWAEEIRQEARESALREGRLQGHRKGRHEGELREARQLLSKLLQSRFPEVPGSGVDRVTDLRAIRNAFDKLLAAESADQARSIVSALTRG